MKLLYIGVMAGDNGFPDAMKDYFNYKECQVSEAKEVSDKFKPDIVFFQIQNEGTDIEIPKYLKANGAYVMNWTGDVRDCVPGWMRAFSRHIDLTLFSNKRDMDTMLKEGRKADYLEIGYDPLIYTPEGTSYKGAPDIVYMGNNFGHFPLSKLRVEMCEALKDFNFEMYGIGWGDGIGSYMGNQRGEATVYRSCKIAVNLSHYSIRHYSSDRLLRILGSGTFCLTHKWEDMEYVDGEHLVVWEDINDLKEKIKYYLENEDERNHIAARGQYYVSQTHTFAHMAEDIELLYLKHKKV